MGPRQFVRTLVKHGNFDSRQLAYFDALAGGLEKTAVSPAAVEYMKTVGPHLLGILAASAVSGMIGYTMASKRRDELRNSLQFSHQSMLESTPEFHSNPENFTRRFNELSLISPTVASNPDLAHKIIAPKLDTGFNLEDIHRLAAIEHHSSTRQKPPHPLSVLTAESIEGVRKAMDFMAPTAIQFGELRQQVDKARSATAQTRNLAAQYAAQNRKGKKLVKTLANKFDEVATNYNNLVDEHNKLRDLSSELANQHRALLKKVEEQEGQEKQGMEQKISDECIGVMMADRYILYKRAGLLKTAAAGGALGKVGDLFKPSYNALKDHFKLIAVPLALGMGIQAVRQMMKQRETAALRSQADQTFAVLKRQSDVIRENPAAAAEAFDALRSFAPTLASKPMIAKTFIEHTIRSDQLPPQTAQMLADAEDKVQSIAETVGGGGFIAGLQAPLSLMKFKVPELGGKKGRKDKEE